MAFTAESGKLLLFACMFGQVKSVELAKRYESVGATYLEGGLRKLRKRLLRVRDNPDGKPLNYIKTIIPSNVEIIAVYERDQFNELLWVFQILMAAGYTLTAISQQESIDVENGDIDWGVLKERKKKEWEKFHSD